MFILFSDRHSYNARTTLRARVVIAGTLGLLVVTGIGLIARPGTLYPWKAAAMFAATMGIAIAFIDRHPFPTFGPANRVTMIRLVLVALATGLVGEPALPQVAGAAVALTAAFTALDGLDGWLARRSRMTSDFGARFDMETDALLIMVLSILVWRHEKAGAWVLLGGLLRYGFVAAGCLAPWMAGPLSPTERARVIAVSHMAGLAVALAPNVPWPFSAIVAALTLAMLSWSFAVDTRRLWRSRSQSQPPGR